MRIINAVTHTKLVYYFGKCVEVPLWTRYLAVDFDKPQDVFMLRAYYHEPDFNPISKTWHYIPEIDPRYQDVATVDLECVSPEHSLVRYL